MSSTIWIRNKPNEGDCPCDRQEPDIVEAVGMQKTGWDWANVDSVHLTRWRRG